MRVYLTNGLCWAVRHGPVTGVVRHVNFVGPTVLARGQAAKPRHNTPVLTRAIPGHRAMPDFLSRATVETPRN